MKHSKSNRTLSLFGAFMLLFCLLTGCGSSGATADSVSAGGATASMSAPAAETPDMPAYDRADGEYYGYDTATKQNVAYSDMSTEESGAAASPADATTSDGTKLIYNASINLETTEFDKANAGLQALTEQLGGYFERNEISNYSGDYRYAYFTVRVPASSFEAFCEQAGQLSHLTYISKSAQDISEQYYDTEIRLQTQQTKYERLLALLEKADKMEDIIDLETAISDTAYQIDQLTGTLRNYDSLVDYATINVQLSEVYQVSEEENAPITFGERLGNAFTRGFQNAQSGLENLVLFVARNLIGLLIFAAVVAAAVIVTRRTIRRRRAPKSEPPEEIKK